MSSEKSGVPFAKIQLNKSSVGSRVGETQMAAPSLVAPELVAGTMVGDYQVEAKIGEGGMATVYSATHPLIGKKAAVKIMNMTADPAAVERFISEARAINQIGHPNIVDVFTFGKLPDGRHYFVMEWLQGETLAARLDRERLSLFDALEILLQIADALAAAHEKEIIHRDLKPENVFLVSVRGRRVMAKLLDFGIAKLAPNGPLSQSKTKTGLFVGTPTHIAPEQARGKNVDHRTDLYSFGVTAYQMILGRLPFEAETAIDIITMHISKPPPLPRDLWPEVPEMLERLLLALLEKDPANRPALIDATAQLTELRDELRHQEKTRSSPTGRTIVPTPPIGIPVYAPSVESKPTVRSDSSAPAVGASQSGQPVGAAGAMPLSMTGSGTALKPGLPRWAVGVMVLGGIGLAMLSWSILKPAPSTKPTPPPSIVKPTPPVVALPTPSPEPPAPRPAPTPSPVAPPRAEVDISVDTASKFELDGHQVAEGTKTVVIPLTEMGTHSLLVTAPRRRPYRTEIVAEPGIKLRLAVTLEHLSEHQGGKPAQPPSRSREYMLDPFGGHR